MLLCTTKKRLIDHRKIISPLSLLPETTSIASLKGVFIAWVRRTRMKKILKYDVKYQNILIFRVACIRT